MLGALERSVVAIRSIIRTSAARRGIALAAGVSLVAGAALVAVAHAVDAGTGRAAALIDPAARSVAVARAGAGGSKPVKARGSDIRLAEYDPARGRAVLAAGKDKVRAGDVIASPPTESAPNGALFKVRTAKQTDKGVEVTTAPATLSEALGPAEVRRTIEAPALDVTVKPLVAGVRTAEPGTELPELAQPAGPAAGQPAPTTPAAAAATVTPTTPGTAEPAPTTPAAGPALPDVTIPGIPAAIGQVIRPSRMDDGGLLLSVDVPLDGVPGIAGTNGGPPKLAGWVGLTPKLIFSFGQKDVDGARPFQAEIGVGGSYQYGWQVHTKLDGLADTGETPLRVPFAEVHLSNTFWIGPVPVVLSVDLTYFYRLTASGDLSIDTEQATTGEFAVGAKYDSRTGWGPLNRNDATTISGGDEVIRGRGDFRATVGADLAVLLYDAAGVRGRLAPYVRATVDATRPPAVLWGLYAGFDLTVGLTIRLRIFGITLLSADVALPPLHGEWKVVASDPEPPAPAPAPVTG